MEIIERKCSFENMKKNPNTNPLSGIEGNGDGFLRKGIVGDWKNHFDGEMISKWKKWMEMNISLNGLDKIKFLNNE